ncbi:hypothetical protein [Streptomyces sp. NBC_01276]|uniref:hypothetical protein n=1 Tax=Streptomyces sp. NBC_01276 TaxID=2903808 RepID=UPI00352D1296
MTREPAFGPYADAEGAGRVRALVEDAVGSPSARIVGVGLTPAPGAYGFLAPQWAVEHPGRSSGARQPAELRVRLVCSLRTRGALRKSVIAALCPEGPAPHTCRVPWTAL